MKFLIASLLLTMSFSSFAKYGAAGCGLGSMIFEGDQTWWKQVLASTTNGSTATQTFGITFGTSNCDASTPLKVSSAKAYIDANKVALANDIARGNGDSLAGLSKVYGCRDVNAFSHDLKENYSGIYPHAQVSTSDITQQISAIAEKSCGVSLVEG